MAFGRRSGRTRPDAHQADPTPEQFTSRGFDDSGTAAPAHGPWDAVHNPHDMDDPAILNFGSLIVRGRSDMQLQLPQDDQQGTIGSIVLGVDDAALELRAFADSRSGGGWDSIRGDMVAEVERLGGTAEELDGPYGRELRLRVPVQLPDGSAGFQPTRVVGVEGPRWFLRGTFLGHEATDPRPDGVLIQSFEDVVVVRGDEPKARREPLLVAIDPSMRLVRAEDQEAANQALADAANAPIRADDDAPSDPDA